MFEAPYIQELQALELPRVTRPSRYFAVIAKGDEVLDWREMTTHYKGAFVKLLAQSDHALTDYAQHLDEVLEFAGL